MLYVTVFLCMVACERGPSIKASGTVEEARVTSPDGQWDALMIREPQGGALGGTWWNVFIVPRAKGAPREDSHVIFQSPTITGQRLVWKQAHLLEVHYDVAHVVQFRNLWGSYELGDSKISEKPNYYVEVRLVPSSPDFSLLTMDGNPRSQ
jgi:hypothetical protein